MNIKSKPPKIFCTFSLLALITSQQLDTKTENQIQAIPRDSIIAQSQGTNIPFEVCVDHANFVRPNPQKHVNRLRSDNHYQDMSSQEILNLPPWKDDFFYFSYYAGLNGTGFMGFEAGLWSLSNSQSKSHDKCVDKLIENHRQDQRNPMTQLWIFNHKLKQIQWKNNKYIFILEYRGKGFQVINYRKTAWDLAQDQTVWFEFVDTKGNRLGGCTEGWTCPIRKK